MMMRHHELAVENKLKCLNVRFIYIGHYYRKRMSVERMIYKCVANNEDIICRKYVSPK